MKIYWRNDWMIKLLLQKFNVRLSVPVWGWGFFIASTPTVTYDTGPRFYAFIRNTSDFYFVILPDEWEIVTRFMFFLTFNMAKVIRIELGTSDNKAIGSRMTLVNINFCLNSLSLSTLVNNISFFILFLLIDLYSLLMLQHTLN